MHINAESAVDLMEGRMEYAMEQQWDQHFASCFGCTAKMEEWRGLREALKRPHLESAPRSLLASVAAIFQPQLQAEKRRTIRQVIATLIYDSFAQPAFAGARGVADSRQVVLRAEQFDIHMSIWNAEESREVLGQIQPRGTHTFAESARLHLLRDGARVSSAEANEFGEFHFSFVPDGFMSLQIDLPHLTVIGTLDVSERN